MANTVFIHCTLSNSQDYTIYKPLTESEKVSKPVSEIARGANGKPLVFHIEGGANVASKAIVTVNGVVTELSKDDVELLRRECEAFRNHEKFGFITVKDFHRIDTRDMEAKDKSAQLTKEDYKKRGRKAPKTAEEANASGDEDDE